MLHTALQSRDRGMFEGSLGRGLERVGAVLMDECNNLIVFGGRGDDFRVLDTLSPKSSHY